MKFFMSDIFPLVKLFLNATIVESLVILCLMLPIYFIRRKRKPNDPKNTIKRLVVCVFLAVLIFNLLISSGLIAMYIDDLQR